jgi:amino acid adenylation domain-containing protein
VITVLPHIIENAAKKFPDKEAFRFGNDTLSFAELGIKMNQLAQHLIASGVKKGDRVGVYMNRCLETVIAIYGIMKAGAAYVPLDAMAPHDRTVFLLVDCDIEILVTTSLQTQRVRKIVEKTSPLKQIVGLSEEIGLKTVSWDTIFTRSVSNAISEEITEGDLAYIMYTSGSTGTPKGIMHSHRSGLAYATLSSDLYDIQPEDKVANHAPLHFDISTFGYFSAPLRGATTVIVSDAHTKLPVSLGELIQREQLTIWYSVPLALIQLYLSGALDKYPIHTLRWVIYGGENFTVKYLRELMLLWPKARFSNSYGPAEVNQCTFYHLKELPESNSYVPIGEVWGDNEYKILDEGNDEVPNGEAGELVVKSSTMMQGYWNNEKLTKKSLFTEISETNQEKHYYRTGDLVRKNEDGNLVFLGRNDRQIKLRGYRIELDEIEAVIKLHHEVKEAAVCVLELENTMKIAAAVLPVKNTKVLDAATMRAFIKKHMPIYAVPETIEVFAEFPKTSSEKTDLNAIKNKLIAIHHDRKNTQVH